MLRRQFLLAPWTVPAALSQNPKDTPNPREWVTAAASRDTAPRVGLVPSDFAGSEEMDGKKIRRLDKPARLDAAITEAQLNDMLRLAVELGGGRRGGLDTAIGPHDWVVIKTSIQATAGDPAWHPGVMTDPRLVVALLRYMAGRGLGRRYSIVEGAPCRGPLWESDWNGRFGGRSYRASISALSKQYSSLRFELVDCNTAPSLEMPVEGRVFAAGNPHGIYHLPRLLRECDKVISIAPLATHAVTGVALSIMNYLGFAPGERYGYPKEKLLALGDPGAVALDMFSFHPADYAIVGGSFASAGGLRRHNVIVAGTNAPAVDAVGAAAMGFESTAIRHLDLAAQHGYGVNDAYAIWTRGAEIDEVKADFRNGA